MGKSHKSKSFIEEFTDALTPIMTKLGMDKSMSEIHSQYETLMFYGRERALQLNFEYKELYITSVLLKFKPNISPSLNYPDYRDGYDEIEVLASVIPEINEVTNFMPGCLELLNPFSFSRKPISLQVIAQTWRQILEANFSKLKSYLEMEPTEGVKKSELNEIFAKLNEIKEKQNEKNR